MRTQLRALPFAERDRQERRRPATCTRYILEHQDDFPGVSVEQVYLRFYPHHDLAAQIFGYGRPGDRRGAQAARATRA